jgi:hypothetical protein
MSTPTVHLGKCSYECSGRIFGCWQLEEEEYQCIAVQSLFAATMNCAIIVVNNSYVYMRQI